MSVLSFDELNKLGKKRRSEPIEEYYEPMRISQKRKKNRIKTALKYHDAVYNYMVFVDEYGEYGDYLGESARQYLHDGILEVINEIPDFDLMDFALYGYVERISREIHDSTMRNKDSQPYYLSDDRATLIAEDESNSIWNWEELQEAMDYGKSHKTWNTMRDVKVRETHRDLEGKTIPLEDYFNVGGYEMMVPRDPEVDAPEETSGCRCWLSFN